MIINKNIEMKQFSNMKIGGIAKSMIEIENEDELINLFDDNQRYYILGNGTNTLINDGYLDINFISLKRLNMIKLINDNDVYVESGADLKDLIAFMRENDLSGIEALTGIPGCIGGLVNMNAGAYGITIFDCIKTVRVYKPELNDIVTLNKDEVAIKYRSTEIKENKWIILSAIFTFDKGFNEELSQEKLNLRSKNHPLEYPNLGSTFKNPQGQFAAQIISDCGLKGHQIGDMQISEKHPNFLINKGNAKFDDVISLINWIQNEVYNKTNIRLQTEIIIVK